MKFTYYLERVADVEIWPIVSLTIFFIFFVCLLIWVLRADQGYIAHMADLPVADGNQEVVPGKEVRHE
ncbi:hypothetical protein SAMN05421823_10128 [Catalinimonas alkaloidigena]|uniref:Cbb3-type cytochrome oxidase component FixQ n=1 Tax=Catalinimonas alkaloidigena TaxID=1075417 RepID=A0A1G8WC57_9BACT|nr:cytochrome C oxidase Cbb3 [Catalinimonas alkaloidigena]SDJ75727.1 hypothetical protein SAMN05421823_10128 [Catalinimonas alkaloidigena]